MKYGVVDPESLPDEQWAKMVASAQFLEDLRREAFREDLETVLSKLLTAIFPK